MFCRLTNGLRRCGHEEPRWLCRLLAACAHVNAPSVALRDVTVVNVIDGSLRAKQTVLVAGNRITAIGPADEISVSDSARSSTPPAAFSFPACGTCIFTRSPTWLWKGCQFSGRHGLAFSAVPCLGRYRRPKHERWTGDVSLELPNSIKRRLVRGELHGPRFLANGPSIDGDPPLGSNSAVVRTEQEARAAVNELVDSGADFIKVYENLSREAYFAIMDQARRRGIPVDGHVPFRVTPEEAADAGQRTFEHVLAMAAGCSTTAAAERERFAGVLSPLAGSSALEGLTPMVLFHHERALYESRDPAACATTIEAYLRNGVAETPNVVAYRNVVNAKEILSDTSRMRLVPQVIRRNWEAMLDTEMYQEMQSVLRPLVPLYSENARLLNEAGVCCWRGRTSGFRR